MTKQSAVFIAILCLALTLEILLAWQYGQLHKLNPALPWPL